MRNSQTSQKQNFCDLCGATTHRLVLTTTRLDGPLVQCENCALYFVLDPLPHSAPPLSESAQAAAAMHRLSTRAQELRLVDPEVETGEQKWRELTASERLADLMQRTQLRNGKLLEVGSSTGEFLQAASAHFVVAGVEADPRSCAVSLQRGLNCFNGTLVDAQYAAQSFDVIALYHVIEHVTSPRLALQEMFRLIRPGGWLVMETPDIATIWFRLLGAKWRQFIPDHRFFFTPETARRLCEQQGFQWQAVYSVGKVMSWRLFVNRMGRLSRPLGVILSRWSAALGLNDKTIYLRLGDVMRLYVQRPSEADKFNSIS